jgi:hypothetical protein
VNNELEAVWKEVVAYLKYYPDKDKDTPVKKIVPFLRRISEPTA